MSGQRSGLGRMRMDRAGALLWGVVVAARDKATRIINATERMWKFFQKHPLSR